MKRTILTLLFTAAALAGTAAEAQRASRGNKPAEAQSTEKDAARGKAEAPALIAAAGVACTIQDAVYRGTGVAADKSKLEAFEVSCQDGLGYVLSKSSTTTTVIDCLALSTTAKSNLAAGKPEGLICTLPANKDVVQGFQSVVSKARVSCTVTDARWLGYSQTGRLHRYEAACQEGGGYVVDRKDDQSVVALSCLQAGEICLLTTREQQFAALTPLVSKAGRSCEISNARVVGTSSGSTYYEVVCSGSVGFMLEAKGDGAVAAIDCLQAARIGEGCKINDMAAVAAAGAERYVAILRSVGGDCVAPEARVIGVLKGTVARDAVELKCSNHPLGLFLLSPTAGGAGKIETNDCIGAGRYGVSCTLTPKQAMLDTLAAAIRQVPRACDVTDFRYMGASPEGDVVEVSCGGAGQNAYVLDVPPSRGRPLRTVTCSSWAERGGDKCSLPGNAGK